MMRLSSLSDLKHLYATRGGLSYGEGVTQIEHALQCAGLAEAEGAAPSLVVAALLHDVGHLFEDEALALKSDGQHEIAGAQALKDLFAESVRGPIALHVAAKRYLCFKEVHYFHALSAASRQSLILQGGPFDAAEAAAFERLTPWREALALRRFDDEGKREEFSSRTFEDFMPLMQSMLVGRARSRRKPR